MSIVCAVVDLAKNVFAIPASMTLAKLLW